MDGYRISMSNWKTLSKEMWEVGYKIADWEQNRHVKTRGIEDRGWNVC